MPLASYLIVFKLQRNRASINKHKNAIIQFRTESVHEKTPFGLLMSKTTTLMAALVKVNIKIAIFANLSNLRLFDMFKENFLIRICGSSSDFNVFIQSRSCFADSQYIKVMFQRSKRMLPSLKKKIVPSATFTHTEAFFYQMSNLSMKLMPSPHIPSSKTIINMI